MNLPILIVLIFLSAGCNKLPVDSKRVNADAVPASVSHGIVMELEGCDDVKPETAVTAGVGFKRLPMPEAAAENWCCNVTAIAQGSTVK